MSRDRKAGKMSLTQWVLVALLMALAGLITGVMYIAKGLKNFRFWFVTSIGYISLELVYLVYVIRYLLLFLAIMAVCLWIAARMA